jgi:hypothetical protein
MNLIFVIILIGRPALFNSCDVRVEIGLVESVSINLLYGYAKEKDVKRGIVMCVVRIIECRNLT